MRIEHIGYPVAEPASVARWYVEHLGFRVARRQTGSPYTHFLVDAAGQGVLEIYHYPAVPAPDYARQDPLLLHLAFDTGEEMLESAMARLLTAGATAAGSPATQPNGDRLVMLRDPWGFPIQLARRAHSLT